MIAALFVDEKGVYAGLPDVDVWGMSRDARLYDGPHPVVAHPPCQLWTNLARVNFKRYGGEHNRPGNDGGCFASALAAVRKWGGVLEHPAESRAWPTHGIPRPLFGEWMCADLVGSWTTEVYQSAYGHKARKRTWLYCCLPNGIEPLRLSRAQPDGTHQCGWFDRKKPTLSKRAASATPAAFRDVLLAIARQADRSTTATGQAG